MHLGLGDEHYGLTVTISAVGSVLACIAYGAYSPHVRMNWLIHLSIVAGILTTLLYLGLHDAWSAEVIAAITGFTYMTGTLVQLDLAARVCPPVVGRDGIRHDDVPLQPGDQPRPVDRRLAAPALRTRARTARHV